MKIGVLALQGDFDKHAQVIKKLGHTCIYPKTARAIEECDRLIIPGGESTTIIRLIEKLELRSVLEKFARERFIMGTCAGLIILGRPTEALPFPSLNVIDVLAERNAYGRQIDSFVDSVDLRFSDQHTKMEGVFIRAPKIISVGESVQPLAFHGKDVVMARNENILVCTFHPELTDNTDIHKYFIEMP